MNEDGQVIDQQWNTDLDVQQSNDDWQTQEEQQVQISQLGKRVERSRHSSMEDTRPYKRKKITDQENLPPISVTFLTKKTKNSETLVPFADRTNEPADREMSKKQWLRSIVVLWSLCKIKFGYLFVKI